MRQEKKQWLNYLKNEKVIFDILKKKRMFIKCPQEASGLSNKHGNKSLKAMNKLALLRGQNEKRT